MTEDLITRTLAAMTEAESVLSPFDLRSSALNQLLFFLKPECFLDGEGSLVEQRLRRVLSKLAESDVHVSGAALVQGRRLEELGVMDRHYGFINTLSKSASSALSIDDRSRILAELDPDSEQPLILGGHEFLSKNPAYNEQQLNELWLSKKSKKIRSGIYVQRYAIDGQNIILVNAFHPMQLSHYTHPDHMILLLLVHSDRDWRFLKDDLIGDTYPERAVPESIRGHFYASRQEYAFTDVSIAHNCVHLSAGPFEAMFELKNFLESMAHVAFSLSETRMSRLMVRAGLTMADITTCLENPTALIADTEMDLFTFTENKNSDTALKEYIDIFRRCAPTVS